MSMRSTLGFAAFSALTASRAVSAIGSYSYNNLPQQAEAASGQIGYNNCAGDPNSQSSKCQTLVVNSIDDFCLWAPPEPNSQIGVTEQIQVAWCTKDGHGSRTIPQGALTGVHFVQTPDFIQITGVGDLTPMNIQRGDSGGELDGHGADGFGNPHGALIYSDAFGGGMTQITEWTNFMSASEYRIRVCKPGPNAWLWCNHVFDEMGCEWNMPADYSRGFDTCQGDSGIPMGLYSSNGNAWGSTFSQGQPSTPTAHPQPATSACTKINNLALGAAAPTAQPAVLSTSSTTTIPTTSSSKPTSTSSTSSTTTTPSPSTSTSSTSTSSTTSTSSIVSPTPISKTASAGIAANAVTAGTSSQAMPTSASTQNGAIVVQASLASLACVGVAMLFVL